MEDKACSFFGHRKIEITDDLVRRLNEQIERCISQGYKTFYFGGYGQFDHLCYNLVTDKVLKNPSLNLTRIFCVPQERFLTKTYGLYNKDDYEKVVYLQPSFEGWYKSIYFRNCAIIDKSDLVIFYAREDNSSGAFKAHKYAKKKNKAIINLYN